MMAHSFNPNRWEVKAGEIPQVQYQPGMRPPKKTPSQLKLQPELHSGSRQWSVNNQEVIGHSKSSRKNCNNCTWEVQLPFTQQHHEHFLTSVCFRPDYSAGASTECIVSLETYFVFFAFIRACLHVYGCCVCLVIEFERVLDFLELDLDGCKLTSRYWKLNLHHPLQEEQVFLIAGQSLYALNYNFECNCPLKILQQRS